MNTSENRDPNVTAAASSARPGDLPTPQSSSPPRRSRLGAVLLLLLLAVAGLSVAFDRLTPYTSEATLQAPVIGVVSDVSGDIVDVSVADNQPVHVGDPLFQIDPQRYAAMVAQAEANLADAGQRVGGSTAGIGAAEARLVDANAKLENARVQAARTLELVARGVYAQARKDDAIAQLTSARAGVLVAAASLEEARRRLGSAGDDNPAIGLARAQLQRALIDLGSTKVVAPVDGIVTNTVLSPGQFAAAGRTQVTIIDVASTWVVANMPENMLGNIKPGDPVEIVLDVMPGQVLRGRVASIASGVDQNIASGLAGDLPRIADRRRWLRGAQRIPVRVEIEGGIATLPIRVGARAGLIIYTQDAGAMRMFGQAWIRFVSLARFAL